MHVLGLRRESSMVFSLVHIGLVVKFVMRKERMLSSLLCHVRNLRGPEKANMPKIAGHFLFQRCSVLLQKDVVKDAGRKQVG